MPAFKWQCIQEIWLEDYDNEQRSPGPSQRAWARGGLKRRIGRKINLPHLFKTGEKRRKRWISGCQGPYQVMPAWKSSLEEHVRIFHSTNEISMHVLCMSSVPRCFSDWLCACARMLHLYLSASITLAPAAVNNSSDVDVAALLWRNIPPPVRVTWQWLHVEHADADRLLCSI